ncbi:MAG: helix-turn-helix transcriptional regulator [Thermoanaerobacter sp.]|nr:helix-turn-helix transcriptional regulator [Thermoanaerobacter sp.]
MNRLKEFRKKRKVTAKQLAEAVGTSRSNISMIEIGLRKADLDLAKRIAEYFGTTIEEIFFAECCHSTGQDINVNAPRASGE